MTLPRAWRRGSLAERLVYLRERDGRSLRAVADVAGISNPYLSQLECGIAKNPSMQALLGLSFAYNIKLDDLMEGLRDG